MRLSLEQLRAACMHVRGDHPGRRGRTGHARRGNGQPKMMATDQPGHAPEPRVERSPTWVPTSASTAPRRFQRYSIVDRTGKLCRSDGTGLPPFRLFDTVDGTHRPAHYASFSRADDARKRLGD